MTALSLFFIRQILGWFFVLARFRFFWDPSRPEDPWLNHARHEHLAAKMDYCGLHRYPYVESWLVALVEVGCGLAVIGGLFTRLSAFLLLLLLLVATKCTAKEKICEQKPVDKVDMISCYLWRVEGIYIALAVVLLIEGGGKWILSALL